MFSLFSRRNLFVQSALTLVGGTAFGQAIALAVLPVLTRLYTPESFSLLAFYVALLSIFSVIACARLEIAIPLPNKEGMAINLFVLSFVFLTATCLAMGVFLLSFSDWVVSHLARSDFSEYLWILPFGVWMLGAYNCLSLWATRRGRFKALASTKVTQAFAGSALQVGLGAVGSSAFGLIFGYLVGHASGFLRLVRQMWSLDYFLLRHVSFKRMRLALSRYIVYPKLSVIEAICNSASVNLPIVIIASFAESSEAGYLFLAMKVMQAPVALVGRSVGQVYLSRAPDELRKNNLALFSADLLRGLIRVGAGPILFIGVVAQYASALLFGSEWARVGDLIFWMTPWFVFQFIVSSLSMSLHVTGNQALALFLQVFGLILRVGLTVFALNVAPSYLGEIYAISGLLFYFAYFLCICIATKIPLGVSSFFDWRGAVITAMWLSVAALCSIGVAELME